MTIKESTPTKFRQKSAVVEAVKVARGTNKELMTIGENTFLISEHDPFPTWQGTLCKKCGYNIYRHSEARNWPKGKSTISIDTPADFILCPYSWFVRTTSGKIEIVSEETFNTLYEPIEN